MSRYPLPRPPYGTTYNDGPSQPFQEVPSYPGPSTYSQYPQGSSGGGYGAYPAYGQNLWQSQSQSYGASLFQNQQSHPYQRYPQASAHASTSQTAKKAKIEHTFANGVKAWRNCSVPGCKFVGPGDDVDVHEEDRHLIFPNGKKVERSEEEERFARRKGPPPAIEGTNITLQTEEDISRWIAERKSKWPSAKRIAEKQDEREAAIARGEILPSGRGRGRGRGGMSRGGRRADPASQAEDWGRPAIGDNHGKGSAHVQRGRGRGRGEPYSRRDRGRNRGGVSGQPVTEKVGDQHPHSQRERDTGWTTRNTESTRDGSGSVSQGGQDITTHDTGIVGLGTYESGSDDDTSDTTSSWVSSDRSSITDDEGGDNDDRGFSLGDHTHDDVDDGNDRDEHNDDTKAVDLIDEYSKETAQAAAKLPTCKFYAKNGKCKFGDKCRFSHTMPEGTKSKPIVPTKQSRPQPVKRANPFERPGMLGELLANPIQNTLSQLSQTIRFLVANDMLDNVELKAGDAGAQEAAHHKISEVDLTQSERPEQSSES